MKQYIWMCGGIGGEAYTINAANEGAAYDKAINHRINTGQTKREAQGWFRRGDFIEEVLGTIL